MNNVINTDQHNLSINPLVDIIESALQTVYDPDFPLIDIYTLGLIYDIIVDDSEQTIKIVMTLTTPACPHGETLQHMIINALSGALPKYETSIDIVFDPMWSISMIKDDDLKRMFE
jgi:metal-sulfur cluster biosynthetic enzyme